MLRSPFKQAGRGGFTLIELLIVIAIILILISIALPNFLEAQIRSRVARVKSEHRSLETAIVSYSTDYNGRYPMGTNWNLLKVLIELTTPVNYITSVDFPDPFFPNQKYEPRCGGGDNGNPYNSYLYYSYANTGNQMNPDYAREMTLYNEVTGQNDTLTVYKGSFIEWANGWTYDTDNNIDMDTFAIVSAGPDLAEGCYTPRAVVGNAYFPATESAESLYSPTNGTKSEGDIIRTGGQTRDGRQALLNQ